jgi:hypothetical protein
MCFIHFWRLVMNRMFLPVFCLAILIVSCAGSGRLEKAASYPDSYVGEGISGKNMDESIAKEQAKISALVDISTQMEVEVRSLAETYLRGTTSAAQNAQIALSDQDYMRVAKVVTQNFLRGATPKEFIHRNDSTIKAVVVMPKKEFYESLKSRIPDQVKREALRVQIQHDEAQKKLDAEIEKRERKLSGDN